MMPARNFQFGCVEAGKSGYSVGTMKEPSFRDCRLTATVDGKVISIM